MQHFITESTLEQRMSTSQTSPFFSRNAAPQNDNPLSAQGRFGRLSLIAWSGFLNLITFFATLALSLFLGIFNFSTYSLENNILQTFLSVAGLGFWVIFLLYFYFSFVIVIRRLHDLNKSGWLLLLLFIPLINFLMAIYILLASGTAGLNQYGGPRATPVWEKILAWLMIILFVLSFMASGSLISYLMGTGELETPQEVIQKGTGYF
jgi:uncharacterized membrane protein YhaH (DUF805 family)